MPEGVAKASGLAYIMDGCNGRIKVTYSEMVDVVVVIIENGEVTGQAVSFD